MAEGTEGRHEALRERLVGIAERWIAEGGLGRLKARPLAAEAGCSVGAIYTVYGDLTALALAVNGRTFRRLGAAVEAALGEVPEDDPQAQLVAMAKAYLRFAAENPRLWRTLFDLELTAEREVPEWYLAALAGLFELIARPLRALFPEAEAARIDLLTRTLFSSVHGIVLLGLEKRISGVPAAEMEEMIEILLRNVASGQSVS